LPLEFPDIVTRVYQRLRYDAGVLGIVGYHAVSEQETVPARFAKQASRSAGRQSFVGQTDGITNGCAEE
jgi:hypothetical protein